MGPHRRAIQFPRGSLTLQRCCHSIVMLMRKPVEAFCVQQQRVLAKPPQLSQDLAWQGYAQRLHNLHIFSPLLHSCIEPGLTEMLDSATHRNDDSMKNMHTFSCLHGIEDRLFHLWACSPERQRQIAKAGVSAGTHTPST